MATAELKRKKLLNHHRVSDLFSVVEYWDEDEIFLFDDNTIGIFVIMQPTPGSNSETSTALDNFFKEVYPKNTALQWSLVSSPDVENILWGYRDIRGNRMSGKDNEISTAMANANHDFYREGTMANINDKGYRFRNYEVWLSIRIKIKKAIPTKTEIEDFVKKTKRTMATLSLFNPRLGDEFDYKRRMNVMLNMYSKEASWKEKAHHEDKTQIDDELRGLLLDKGCSVEPLKHGVKFYDENDKPYQFARSMSVRQYPDAMYYGNMINLIGQWMDGSVMLSEHYILTLHVFYPDQQVALKNFNKRRAFINNQARGSILQYLDKLRFQKSDFSRVNREIDQENSQIIEYALQVVSFCKTEADSDNFFQTLSGLYDKSNFKLKNDMHFTLPFMLGALPFGLDESYKQASFRFAKATTKGMKFITPHIASWKGNSARPSLVLSDRFGQVIPIDFFNTNTNYNIYCAATSGAGKSFLLSTIINAMLGTGVVRNSDGLRRIPDDGAQIFVVDVGRSYQYTAAMYEDSQFLEFGGNARYTLNPFRTTENINEQGQLPMIRSLIKVMASPSGSITDEQNAILFDVIKKAWDLKGQGATVTDVKNLCLDWPVECMHPIGRQLSPFSEGGVYEDFFSNKYEPVSFESRLIVCELEEIKSDKHLQLTVLMSLMMGIQRKMYLSAESKDPRRRLFFLDEGWEFLKESKGESMVQYFGEFIETGWRRFRKYGASGCLATQSVMDAFLSEVGKAVVANSAWMLLLNQQSDELQKLKKLEALGGGDAVIKMLETIKTVKPNPSVTDEAYSEVLIKHESLAHPCRLYTSRKMQLINTTNKDEKDLIYSYLEKGMHVEEAIDLIVKEEKSRKR